MVLLNSPTCRRQRFASADLCKRTVCEPSLAYVVTRSASSARVRQRLELCPPRVLHREIRPPTPRSEATVCAVTKGNIAELAASAFVALLVVLLSVRTIGYKGEQCSGGESVSQPALKNKAFSAFPD